MRIMLLGSSGMLGTELRKLDSKLICPSHEEADINDYADVFKVLNIYKPDIVINCAAVTDNRLVEKKPQQAIQTNIIGAANVAIACQEFGARLVYISTDYVYKGDRGNYKEGDEIQPFNLYAYTKLGGECSAKGVKNHLIIRTSFGKSEFDYDVAFTDKWVSKDYVDVIAPLIYEAALSPLSGVLNLGTERKTLYEYAVRRNPNVKPIKLSETNYFTPYDTSLNLQKWSDYKGGKAVSKAHTNCRVCGSDKLIKYLDLGMMPLANNLEFTAIAAKNKERYPLQVMLCDECSLSQLSVVVSPEKLFSYYTYRSSINKGYIEHCRQMAHDLMAKHDLNEKSFHIDLAGNDSALLQQFKEIIGCKVLNIDPASNLTAISEANGIPAMTEFWGNSAADKVLEQYGKADLITATNVFAHVDDVTQFIEAAKKVLSEKGVLVLEFPYLVEYIENLEYDTSYHEHLSYISILPLSRLCNKTGMKLISIEPQNIHGGTVRVTIADEKADIEIEQSVSEYINSELKNGYDKPDKYLEWGEKIKANIKELGMNLYELKKQGKKIAAFACSAKGNTLLNSCTITTDIISFIVDETSEKVGKYSPGTGIPIVSKEMIAKEKPDYMAVLSWNFKEAIKTKAREAGFDGKFLIPIPHFTVED